MWWNTSTKILKRYTGSGWSAAIEDQKAIEAYGLAEDAEDLADQKRRVFVATPYPPYDVGDLWDRGGAYGLWRCKTSRASGSYYSTDWQRAADVTDEIVGAMAYEEMVSLAKLDETIVSGGYIKTSLIETGALFIGDFSGAGAFAEKDFLNYTELTGTKPPSDADKTSDIVGSMAYYDTVTAAMEDETIIIGGYINTNMIEVGSITFDKFGDLTGQVNFTDSGELTFGSSTNVIWGGSFGVSMIAGALQQIGLWTNQIQISSKASSNATVNIEANGYIAIGTYNDNIYLGGEDIILQAGYSNDIDFKFGTSTYMYMNRYAFVPASGRYPQLGNTGTQQWSACYAQAFYRNGTALDGFDDLYELSQIAPQKRQIRDAETREAISEEDVINPKINMPYIDPFSLPEALTNIDDVILKLKQDNCDLITEADIEEWLHDYDEAGWMIHIDVGLFSDLTNGAVRQLDSEMISMFDLLSSRITALEQQLAAGNITK